MEFTFDPAKNTAYILKHGMALVRVDDRADYGEMRYEAIGPLNGHLCVMVFTVRAQTIRAISLRKANSREVKRYANRP